MNPGHGVSPGLSHPTCEFLAPYAQQVSAVHIAREMQKFPCADSQDTECVIRKTGNITVVFVHFAMCPSTTKNKKKLKKNWIQTVLLQLLSQPVNPHSTGFQGG